MFLNTFPLTRYVNKLLNFWMFCWLTRLMLQVIKSILPFYHSPLLRLMNRLTNANSKCRRSGNTFFQSTPINNRRRSRKPLRCERSKLQRWVYIKPSSEPRAPAPMEKSKWETCFDKIGEKKNWPEEEETENYRQNRRENLANCSSIDQVSWREKCWRRESRESRNICRHIPLLRLVAWLGKLGVRPGIPS